MADEKQKTLGYRRAEFLTKVDKTLEQYLAEAHTKLADISQRRINLPGYPILQCLQHLHQDNLGVFIHIAAYTPGEKASVVPALRGVASGEVETAPPPEHCEFMDGDIMALIVGNDVLLCSTNLHEKRAQKYMQEIILAAGIDKKSSQFGLCKKANIDKLKLIQKQGVKSVNLNVSLFDASVEHLHRNTIKKKLGGGLMDEIKALLSIDKKITEINDAENLTAQILLTYDSRRKKGIIGRQRIEKIARQMIEEDDEGFSIKTLSGETIRGSDIALKKSVSLPKHGKSVFCGEAWRALESYYYELKAGGLLEQ